MQGVMSLQRARIHKKEEPKRLNNLSGNFVEYFYKDWLDDIGFSVDINFQKEIK